jgi:DNA-binding IclR family transcriptional regulator
MRSTSVSSERSDRSVAVRAAIQQAREHIQTADRVLATLEVLVFAPSTASAVADAVGMHDRTALRFLRTLERSGYVERCGGGRFVRRRPSVRLLAMAAQFAPRLPLVQCGREAVDRLEVRTGLAAYLAVPSYGDVLVIASSGRGDVRPWMLLPALGDAAGRVLAACRDEWWSAVLGGREHADVANARERGYAVARSEETGAGSLAVAVPRDNGSPIAALGLRGSGDVLSSSEQGFVELLQTEAARLGRVSA